MRLAALLLALAASPSWAFDPAMGGPRFQRPALAEFPVFLRPQGAVLGGVVASPPGALPMTPAIVLLHGSGPSGRDADIPADDTFDGKPAKLFKQLSDAFVAAGFVVLRYDKRGGADRESKDHYQNSAETLAADAVEAVRYLRAGRAARRPVILVGHSEGTRLAPMVAERVRVDGMILLGAMARRLDEILRYQVIDRELAMIARFDADSDGTITESEARSSIGLYLLYLTADPQRNGAASMSALRAKLEEAHQRAVQNYDAIPWYRSHLALEPNTSALPRYRGPVLILQGEADSQTPLGEARALEAALAASGHPDFEVRAFPGLGHGFAPNRHGWIPTVGPIEAAVLDAAASWASARWR